ncbi:MAG TPA: RNA polymerase sigma factor RpoH [Acetobacteraceae bacterium]|nr:RNA polymerase sigma factor RpoH [Acetobacteraceae bacterium]
MSSLTYTPDSENLGRYLRAVHAYPILSPDEEVALSRAWLDNRDQSAANKLVTSHLRLVARIAMGYRGYGLPLNELISEGNIGMMRAVQGFDPNRGFRLATYAMWWIRASIQEYILHSWSLVKIGTTAAQKKLFFNLRRLKGQIQAIDEGDLRPDQVSLIADMLNVPEQDVISMNGRLAASDHSLNAPMHQDDEDQWQDRLADQADSQEIVLAEREEFTIRRALLSDAFKVLNRRERHILIERRLKENAVKLDVLAEHYNVSRERIRQLEVRAITKLQKTMKASMLAGAAAAKRGAPAPMLAASHCS